MHIEITKAKIKSRIFLAYEYTQNLDNVQNKISTSSDAIIHEDLEGAFMRLIPHFAFLTEETTEKEVEDCIQEERDIPEDILNKFKVSGFSIGGSGENVGVTISGQKKLESGKSINFNTPFQKFHDDTNPYRFEEELIHDVDKLKEEVMQYMEGKQAEKPQVEMDFGYDSEEEEFETVDVDEDAA